MKILKITSLTLASMLLSLAVLPFFFKDSLQTKVEQAIQQRINARVYYKDFSVSFFKNFPQLTFSLEKFGVTGNAPFTADTLIQAKSFDVSLSIPSLLAGTIALNHIGLESPRIAIKVLKDGSKNYDIMKAQPADTDTQQASSKMSIKISSWKITDGMFVYDNRLTDTYADLQHITHQGSGNIDSQVYDLLTQTAIESATFNQKGTTFIANKRIDAHVNTRIDNLKKQYDFSDNSLTINDFKLNFGGMVALPDTNTVTMDLTFDSDKKNDFKNLLSILQGLYSNKFSEVEADGTINFSGKLKGNYSPHSYPTFAIDLKIDNGSFKYSQLPTGVSGITLDIKASNTTNRLQTMVIALNKFTADLGKNPIRAKASIEGVQPASITADIMAKIDLAALAQLFPMDGLSTKGLFGITLQTAGIYDTLARSFPKTNATMNLVNGFIQSDKFPEPIQNLNLNARLNNADGSLAGTTLWLDNLQMLFQQEPFQVKGLIQNFENYQWNMEAKGMLDLTNLTKIYPINSMVLAGKITTDILSKGNYAAIKSKQYANLPTSGTATIHNFSFVSKDYPQGFRVSDAQLNFSPQSMNVTHAKGFMGTSDFEGHGVLTNYLGYGLANGTLGGTFNITSQNFKVNEWMTDAKPTTASNTTQALQVVEIPENLNILLNATVAEALYDKMKMKNINGALTLANGAVKMQNVRFNALGGSFVTNGSYNTQNIAKPLFDFALNLENIQIPEAFQHLSIVRKLLPMAQYAIGEVSSKLSINGELGQDMMPKMTTLNGSGLFQLLRATLQQNPVLQKITETSQLAKLKNLQLNNVLMQAQVNDGSISFKPFDIAMQDYKMTVSGISFLDGGLNYAIAFDVPTGNIGQAFGSAFSRWTGKSLKNTDRVTFDLKMTGTFKAPILAFNGSSTAQNLKSSVVNEAKAQLQAETNRLKNEAESRINTEKEKLLQEAYNQKTILEAKARTTADSLKRIATDRAKKYLDDQKKSLLDGFFKKVKPVKRDSI